MMTDLWDESADEDRQQIARMMFEEIVYDLDTLQIVAFTLKPWAERFLDLRAALWAKEQGGSPAGGEGDTHPDDGGDDEGGGGQGTSDGELGEDGGAVSGEHSAEKANRSGLKTTSDLCPIGALEARTAPRLEDGRISVPAALAQLYHSRVQPDKSLSTERRDALIRARHAAGVSQAELARQFGISYQRVHQIVRGRGR